MFSDTRCGHGYTVRSRINGVVTDIRCVHGYTECSRIYSVFTYIRCHGYKVWSPIDGV